MTIILIWLAAFLNGENKYIETFIKLLAIAIGLIYDILIWRILL